MFCISINHKSALSDIRQKFAFTPEQRRALMTELISGGVSQCAVLCTCNRTEVYFCGASDKCTETVKRKLAELSGISAGDISRYMMMFYGKKAVEHLFRVQCGIESMVMGEDEILGQTKSAYYEAKECGAVGFELNMIFQAATACAKKIKTCTALSKTPASIATLAANAAARLGDRVNVLVIGATGKIGSSVVKNLISHKNVSVTVTLRSHSNAFAAESFRSVRTVDYSGRYHAMRECDCVISATSGPHYTVTAKGLADNCAGHMPGLFIDLAVPPDIDRTVPQVCGAELMEIDSFRRLAEENNAIKKDSAEAACDIIAEETDKLYKTLLFHDFLPHLGRIKEKAQKITFEKLLYKLRDELEAQQLAAVLNVLKQLESEE